jgi:hypothetical protein
MFHEQHEHGRSGQDAAPFMGNMNFMVNMGNLGEELIPSNGRTLADRNGPELIVADPRQG